jgi:hypothetical protein
VPFRISGYEGRGSPGICQEQLRLGRSVGIGVDAKITGFLPEKMRSFIKVGLLGAVEYFGDCDVCYWLLPIDCSQGGGAVEPFRILDRLGRVNLVLRIYLNRAMMGVLRRFDGVVRLQYLPPIFGLTPTPFGAKGRAPKQKAANKRREGASDEFPQ